MSTTRKTGSTTSTAPLPNHDCELERLPLGQTPPQAPPGTAALQAAAPLGAPASVLAPGVGPGAGVTARRVPRWNVTEAERLCYSRRKLHAISALRNAGLDPTICGLHKEYRVPGMRGRVYLLEDPANIVYAFATLAQIERYAAEWQAQNAAPGTWNPWRSGTPMREPQRVDCVWPECRWYANGLLAGQPLCRPHALIYEQMLLCRI